MTNKVKLLLREIKEADRKNCPHILEITQEIQDEAEYLLRLSNVEKDSRRSSYFFQAGDGLMELLTQSLIS